MSSSLIDPFGRRIDYLRLSLTDKCNMRCFYCIPKGFKDFQPPAEWLKFDEISRIVRVFAELGVSRFRLTGGEPLVRQGVVGLVNDLSSIRGVDDLSLSTNASLLDGCAHDLRAAGISRINVSLDSLQQDRFHQITGTQLQPVINGLMAAKDAEFKPVKINMLALKGVNDNEFGRMVEFCIEHDFTLRFIETMPMGASGQSSGKHYMPLSEVRHWLERRFELLPAVMPGGGPAHYVQVSGTDLRIGFISPISRHFCETCNRVRLSVDGTLYLCLGQSERYELRPLLRNGISDDGLKNAIHEALALKPQKHDFVTQPGKQVRIMSLTGG
jgi:cyclic pyranopterin phosphate synthase